MNTRKNVRSTLHLKLKRLGFYCRMHVVWRVYKNDIFHLCLQQDPELRVPPEGYWHHRVSRELRHCPACHLHQGCLHRELEHVFTT